MSGLSGLLRASHSRNLAREFAYREAYASLLCSFRGTRPKVILLTVQAQFGNDFRTL